MSSYVTESKLGENIFVLTSKNGVCIQSDTSLLYVKANLNAPNVFTANGDGINETFKIRGVETYPEVVVEIVNRLGQMVYRTKSYSQNEWDGGDLPAGVYFYVIETEYGNHTGIVHLIR